MNGRIGITIIPTLPRRAAGGVSHQSVTSSSGHWASFRCSVRRLSPIISAALVRLPRALIKASRSRRFSLSSTESDGPDVYDITARPDAPLPHRWRVRRHEISDEIELLDHVRRVGRITIELEDSIRS